MKIPTVQQLKEKILELLNRYFIITEQSCVIPLTCWGAFFGVGVISSIITHKIFFFFNFLYIGTALSLGILMSQSLKKRYNSWARKITQILIGFYMLFFMGILSNQNMQIEGMFYYLIIGTFSGVVLHYFIAKVLGPIIFNRGWCGWACWTAMVLDILPWKNNQGRYQKYEAIRYAGFLLSFLVILLTFSLIDNHEFMKQHELYWFILGNVVYYFLAIMLAYRFKDNRAFCKYLCPITVLMKITARYAWMKVEIASHKCTECGLCEQNCPMDVKLLAYKKNGQRILSTECIMCSSCIDHCPKEAIRMTYKRDYGVDEFIQYKEIKDKEQIKSQ
ncbi:MAG: 4Fe-4S dicluster domain-containing protein [Clostridia bacterium]|nr:4Fe-4S dicluster domain-containing protein [Clostridia bacterium]